MSKLKNNKINVESVALENTNSSILSKVLKYTAIITSFLDIIVALSTFHLLNGFSKTVISGLFLGLLFIFSYKKYQIIFDIENEYYKRHLSYVIAYNVVAYIVYSMILGVVFPDGLPKQ